MQYSEIFDIDNIEMEEVNGEEKEEKYEKNENENLEEEKEGDKGGEMKKIDQLSTNMREKQLPPKPMKLTHSLLSDPVKNVSFKKNSSFLGAGSFEGIECGICLEFLPAEESYALNCEHWFCSDCWRGNNYVFFKFYNSVFCCDV